VYLREVTLAVALRNFYKNICSTSVLKLNKCFKKVKITLVVDLPSDEIDSFEKIAIPKER
jgi:hypothetical protein